MSIIWYKMWVWIAFVCKMEIALGTTFGNDDLSNPNENLACLHRDIRPTDIVVAHRTLPCKSKVLVYNPRTGRGVVAIVGDVGPFGKSKLSKIFPGKIDLSEGLARKIRANGWELIFYWPL